LGNFSQEIGVATDNQRILGRLVVQKTIKYKFIEEILIIRPHPVFDWKTGQNRIYQNLSH
jgi:hypothetical protein